MLKKLFVILLFIFMGICYVYAQPSFKGGTDKLNYFLADKIIYPEYAKENCISGTVKVSFQLDKAGIVLDAKVSQGTGTDLDDEALRVVKLTSGKWTVPADYGSESIILPVRFQSDQTRCGSRSAADIALAINNYKAYQQIQDIITDYYKAKDAGKANVIDEPKILKLKEQIGINNDFIDHLLEEANEKLRQGDNAGACVDWTFIHNVGSDRADEFIARYCR